MKLKQVAASIALTLGLCGAASAGPVLTDLTTDDYITVGGLDWAWAAPIRSEFFFGSNVLSAAELHAGWREASDAEWAARPAAAAFGTKCAAQYWNSFFTHCDFGDPEEQHRLAGVDGDAADLWYVRGDSLAVPEPGSLALIALALTGLGLSRRRKA